MRSLRPYARNGAVRDATLRVWRRVVVAIQRRRGAPSRYQFNSGGVIIAVLGGDGSGKTTTLTELSRWLGGFFDVKAVHLGKPKWSWTTRVIRGALKVMASMRRVFGGDGAEGRLDEPRRLVWLACQARDRYRLYRKARRHANRGGLVISDRYPHPALRLMDVPQIGRLTEGRTRSRFVRGLIRIEDRYHERISEPDVVVVLRLDPEEAGRRKVDENYDYVVERSGEIWETDWSRWPVGVIDAGQTRESVAADVKSHIWSALG